MRALLLPGPAHKMDSNEMITCGELRERGRAFERSEALVTVFADWELLHAADADARAQADTRRLRWLAAEHDLSEHVAFVPPQKARWRSLSTAMSSRIGVLANLLHRRLRRSPSLASSPSNGSTRRGGSI